MYAHIDRLASHLFSPTDLRFSIDYENIYGKEWLEKGAVAARLVSREWERKNIDMIFGHGVKEGLTYGACILKQLGGKNPDGSFNFRGGRLVMPWQFGVYNEGANELSEQEAVVETVWLTKHEIWRRIRSLPDAQKLYKRILGNATKDNGATMPSSFMHQVLSTATLNTAGGVGGQPQPGGIVQLTNDPNYATLGPQIATDLYPLHEIWVKDDNRDDGEDYTTIQLIEPDILVAPLFKHCNLFAKDVQPYSLIQANYEPGYFWGRSELVDLLMLQGWLSEHLDDARRLMGQQVDKILAFPGYEGLQDEAVSTFKANGYMGLPQGASVTDLTPKMPEQLLPIIGQIIELMDRVSGFPPTMSGQGESGVRSGVHAETLMKTGSPRLRDRSLLVERQVANAADTTLSVLEVKQATALWTNPEKEETEFLLSQLPEDRRIAVDSHSSSPIYHDDNMQLLAFGLKSGVVTGESFIEQSSLAHKDVLIDRLKAKEAAQQELMRTHPEFFAKHGGGHGKSELH